MFDRLKALENAQRKLLGQQANLKSTLAELDYITKAKPDAAELIKIQRTKRDRQAHAIRATEQLIELYSTVAETKKAR